jgi:hypothetical protein
MTMPCTRLIRSMVASWSLGLLLWGGGNAHGQCVPAPAGLVSWWPGEDSATDIVSGNNGFLQGSVSYAPGEVGQAFLFTTTNDAVRIPANPTLNIGAGPGLTIELWVKPTDLELRPLAEFNNAGAAWGVHFYISAGYGPGSLYANLVDLNGQWHQIFSPGGIVESNVFQQVAVTYDQASGVATLYHNGVAVASQPLGHFTPQTTYEFYLGKRPGPETVYTYAGLLDEASLYSRALSADEIAAIYNAGSAGKCAPVNYPVVSLQPTNQTVTAGATATLTAAASGAQPLSYQWAFNETNLAGATNSWLTLPNVQPANGGTYAVTVTNLYGTATSSNAILTVLAYPPVITLQPVSVTNILGGNANFRVAVSGTPPFTFQWSLNGTNLTGATNAWLTLNNIQPSQAGAYAVLVANNFGSTNSAAAELTVLTYPPVITQPPVSVTNVAGTSASFQVAVSGTPPFTYQWSFDGTNLAGATNAWLTLPEVQSSQAGNYSVWVANDYGSTSASATLTVTPQECVPPPAGLVSWWPANDNASDLIGTNNATLQGAVTYAPGEVGDAFLFTTTNDAVLIPASSSLNVGASNGLTIELWIEPADFQLRPLVEFNNAGAAWGVHFYSSLGNPGTLYANLVDTHGVSHTMLTAPGFVKTNVLQHVALTYDKTTGIATIYYNGAVAKQQTLGSFTPQTSYELFLGHRPGPDAVYTYAGLLDEASLYSRSLSASEIAAIHSAGSDGKCPPFTAPPLITAQPTNQTDLAGQTATFSVAVTGAAPLSYQWSLNLTNLPGATNSLLTLTNVQPSQSGAYSVQVADRGGATNSASVILTVVLAPGILQQPQSQTVLSYQSASFTVSATGTGPLSYQWLKNGTNLVDGGNISGSTTTNLMVTQVSPADAGNYEVVVSNAYATTNSAAVVLTVPETVVSLGSTNAVSGTTVVVPVWLDSLGTEFAYLGSVSYDPTKLVLQGVQLGTDDPSAYLQEVDTLTNSGYAGFAVFFDWSLLPTGTQEVAQLVFQTLPVTNTVAVNLTWGDSPTTRQLVDQYGNPLPVLNQNGTLTLTPGIAPPVEYEADVYPRFNGDGKVNLSDWVEVGRMVAGLDIPTNSDEFLRADTAPRNAPDGVLTVADWVQAGRYVLGLDPLTPVPNPNPDANLLSTGSQITPLGSTTPVRTLQVTSVSGQRGQAVNVPVQLVCTTNENAVGLPVSYDPNLLKLTGVTTGTNLAGAQMNVNTLVAGQVGVALALIPLTGAKQTLPAGTNEVAVLQFLASTNAVNTVPLSLVNSAVVTQVADNEANVLATSLVNGAVTFPPGPTVQIANHGGSLLLDWPVGSGSYQLLTAKSPAGPWQALAAVFTTNGNTINVTVPNSNQVQFFRLEEQ